MTFQSTEGLSLAGIIALGIIFIPLLGAFFVFRVGQQSEKLRDYLAIGISGVTFFLAVVLFRMVMINDGPLLLFEARAGFMEPLFFLQADMLSAFITLMASFIWFLATIFSPIYMDHEKQRNRYYLFFLLSLGSCLGVFLSGDFLTLFFFFELMTFASYVLVIHAESDEAMSAGRNYLFLGVGGGLALLSGLFLLYHYTGTLAIGPSMEALAGLGNERYLLAGLLILGFGVKAGMAPVHIWLPQAHPVAPAPASALLSGLMIKTGAYGIIRVLNMVFAPLKGDVAELWATSYELGYTVIWIGIVTMSMAAFLALFQTNAKRILAYSSVSQMGYILMGLGAAAYLGYEEGAIGLSGSMYHIVNHAFFKAAMFMIVGAIYVRAHQLDITKLGGLWRKYPVMTVAFLMAAGGITGVPLLNGYTSKTVLHHAIEDAFHHGDVYPLFLAERIFTVTSIFTVCYIAKLTYGIFFGPRPKNLDNIKGESLTEKIIFGTFGASILALGVFPSLLMKKVFLPATAGFSFYPGKIEYLGKLNFWDTGDLMAIGQVLVLGLALFMVAGRWLNKAKLPTFLSIEHLIYRPFIKGIGFIYTGFYRLVDTLVEKSYVNSPYPLRILTVVGNGIDRVVEDILIKSPGYFSSLCFKVSHFDRFTTPKIGYFFSNNSAKIRDLFYNEWINIISALTEGIKQGFIRGFRTLLQIDTKPSAGQSRIINFANLDFSLIIVVIMLIIILGVTFILR